MNEVNNNNLNGNQLNNTSLNQDDELLRIYVGENYDKLIQEKFNPSAFFLTTPYLFYRKKYLWGFLYMIATVIVELLISGSSTALCILIGVFFNKYYIQDCRKQIEKIKSTNVGASPDTLKQIIMSKGGTSIASAIILSILLTLLIVGAAIGLVIAMVIPVINQSMKYDYDTSVNIKDKFVFENKMNFEDLSDENYYGFDYEPIIDDYDSCTIYLHKIKNYNSTEDFIKENAIDKYKTNPIIKKANNIEWKGYINSTFIADFYVYATEINDEVYILEYDMFGISESGPCHKYKDNIFEYIKVNEDEETDSFEEIITPSDDIIMQY